MDNVTAVIISFLRQEYTIECIRSLKKSYPKINILVAENGEYSEELKDIVERAGGRYIVMPFDSGVCYARNRLVELVETEFVLVGDDDFQYSKKEGLSKMLSFMKSHKRASLIGGRIVTHGVLQNYQGDITHGVDEQGKKFIHFIPTDISSVKYDAKAKMKVKKCDIVFNFFIGRTDHVKKVKWDEKIKVAYEHSDWFIEAKKEGLSVYLAPDCIVVHKPENVVVKKQAQYEVFRFRKEDKEWYFEKHGIDYTITFKGIKDMIKKESIEPAKKNDTKKGSKTLNKYYAPKNGIFANKEYNKGEIIVTTQELNLPKINL